MFNLLLLSPIETVILIVVIMLAIVFIYAFFRKPILIMFEKIKNSIKYKNKKPTEQDNSNPDEVIKEEHEIKKESKEKNKYNEILEKVHQNRELYYKEEPKNNNESAKVEESVNDPVSKEIDYSKLDLFQDFDFEDNNNNSPYKMGHNLEDDLNYNFAGLNAEYNFDNSSFNFNQSENEQVENLETASFKKSIMRRRMIKRNQNIEEEIESCSDRIKAIIMLDIINKKKF